MAGKCRRFLPSHLVMVLVALVVSACVTSDPLLAPDASVGISEVSQTRVLVMPPNVRVNRILASGISEIDADEQAVARAQFAEDMRMALISRAGEVVSYDSPDPQRRPVHDADIQAVRLYQAVSSAINRHHYTPQFRVPTRGTTFEWTLGSAVASLRETYQADYALFLDATENHASAGRVGVAVVTAVLFGASAVSLPPHVMSTALVDLRTGDIVWYDSRTYSRSARTSGIREREDGERGFTDLGDAPNPVERVLADLP